MSQKKEEFAIQLENISKKYRLFNTKMDRLKESLHPLKKQYHRDFFALKDINLNVKKGEILGIVGINGSGKSTMLKVISGITQATSGIVKTTGNIVPLIELGSGFNPEYTGMENIYFYNSLMGMSRKDTDNVLDNILSFADIGKFIHQPLKSYSSGMRARLSFAVSVNINPDILIIDEVLSVGDELFRRKSFAKIEEFFSSGKTILFVSHSIQNINQLCSRAIFLHEGNIILDGAPKWVTMNYQKFIFSKPEEKQKLLEDYKKESTEDNKSEKHSHFSNIFEPDLLQNESDNIASENIGELPYLVKNLNPLSMVITKNAKITVSNIHLETEKSEEVNHIIPGTDYTLHAQILMEEDIGEINMRLEICNIKGVVLTWQAFPSGSKAFDKNFKQGNVIQASWKFYCNLIPNTYFISLSINRWVETNSELIYRGKDLAVFKVLGSRKKDRGGLFDPGFKLKISY